MLEGNHDILLYHAKFYCDQHILRHITKQIWTILENLLGAAVPTSLPIMVQFATLNQTYNVHKCAKFHLGWFILSPWLTKAPNFPHFQLWHSVVAPPSGIETKLNVDAQLQTFPYPTISKPLLSSNAFWVMSSQTMLFKSMTDKLTDKKKSTFLAPRWRAKSEPHQIW